MGKKNTTGNSWIRTATEGHFDLIDALCFIEYNIDKSNPFPKVNPDWYGKMYPKGFLEEEENAYESLGSLGVD